MCSSACIFHPAEGRCTAWYRSSDKEEKRGHDVEFICLSCSSKEKQQLHEKLCLWVARIDFKFTIQYPIVSTRWGCCHEKNTSKLQHTPLLFILSFLKATLWAQLLTLCFPSQCSHMSVQKNSHVCTKQNKALKVFICLSDLKYCDPQTTLRAHCVMRGIPFFPRQKRWHHWSHLMCALNIRWGRKGSIQEFSTLLRAPGLPSPSRPSQATLRTRTGWNRPPSPQQQQQHKQSQLRARRLETKQRMIAKPEVCLRPLGCSHRSSCAPPCAARLLRDSFHKKPSKFQVNDFHRWDTTCTYLTPWQVKHLNFHQFHLVSSPAFVHSFFPPAALGISILLLIPSLTHSPHLPLFFEPRLWHGCSFTVSLRWLMVFIFTVVWILSLKAHK